MRRPLALAAASALALLGATAAAAAPQKGAMWARPQIGAVVRAGFMAKSVSQFRPQAPLTQGALAQIVTGLNERLTPPPPPPPPPPQTTTQTETTTTETTDPATGETTTTVAQIQVPVTVPAPKPEPAPAPPWPLVSWRATSPGGTVSLNEFDHVLVNTLGLSDASSRILAELRRAGLRPPARAGWETIARLIGLRINHPTGEDWLELEPDQPITRAEAAYSLAQALRFDSGARGWVEQAADAFSLPALDAWQRRILTTAVSYVGYPYIWGGTSPGPQTPLGIGTPGGFDCSGFVWRVYKLTPYAGEGRLASTLAGRTTYQMAAEADRSMKIFKVRNLKPGDVLLFGRGPRSKSSEIDHAAIYLGNDWIVQSSGNGVTITPFDGWYRSSFAFARRPLREAGLDR